MNLKEWRGFKGKTPCLRPPHAARNRGGGKIGAAALGGAWPATPRPRRRLEVGGNRAGRRWGPIPPFDLRGGGPQRRRHGGGRRPALAGAAAALKGSTAARTWRKREEGTSGF